MFNHFKIHFQSFTHWTYACHLCKILNFTTGAGAKNKTRGHGPAGAGAKKKNRGLGPTGAGAKRDTMITINIFLSWRNLEVNCITMI